MKEIVGDDHSYMYVCCLMVTGKHVAESVMDSSEVPPDDRARQ